MFLFVRVCLYANVSPELHIRSSPILCMMPMDVPSALSCGVTIRYVLPVVWMASYLHVMDHTEACR